MGLAIRRQGHRCHLDILGGQWDMSYFHTHGPQYAIHHKFHSLISSTFQPLSLYIFIYHHWDHNHNFNTHLTKFQWQQLQPCFHHSGLQSFDLGDAVPSTFANRGPGFTSFGDALCCSCAGMSNLVFLHTMMSLLAATACYQILLINSPCFWWLMCISVYVWRKGVNDSKVKWL